MQKEKERKPIETLDLRFSTNEDTYEITYSNKETITPAD